MIYNTFYMKLFVRIIFVLFSNIVAILAAVYFIKGFSVAPTIQAYLEISAVFAIINVFIRPFLKLILSPLIMLTLGVGIIIVNAISLYILDWAMDSMTISGLYPLVYATLIISAVNFVLGFTAKGLSGSK
jgi:putative membrane protein